MALRTILAKTTPSKTTFATLAAAALLIFLTSQPAHAYYSLIDTGDLLQDGQYQASVEPQWGSAGYNTVFRIDSHVTDSSDARAIVGFGNVDFQIGAAYKWVPFPDTAKQPAIGGEAEALFARYLSTTELTVLLTPLTSKTFETEIGDVTPYAALPFGVTWKKNDTVLPTQLVLGAKYDPLNWDRFSFYAEVGMNLHESYGHGSIGLAYRFEDDGENALTSRPKMHR